MAESNGYVKSSIFRMAMLILVGAISGLFGLYIAQNNAVADLRVDIASIESDIGWIKDIAAEGKKTSYQNFDSNEATLNLAIGREKLAERLSLELEESGINIQ